MYLTHKQITLLDHRRLPLVNGAGETERANLDRLLLTLRPFTPVPLGDREAVRGS